MRNGA
jgi:hypothetical protein